MTDLEHGGRYPATTNMVDYNIKDLSKSEWALLFYYYNLSKWDERHQEEHNYFYKNSLPTQAKIAEHLGVCAKTISRCHASLQKKGYLKQCKTNDGRIFFKLHGLGAKMLKIDANKFEQMLLYSRACGGDMTIARVYTLLKWMSIKYSRIEDKAMTMTQILSFLDLAINQPGNKTNILNCLDSLHKYRFMVIEEEEYKDKFGQVIVTYYASDYLPNTIPDLESRLQDGELFDLSAQEQEWKKLENV